MKRSSVFILLFVLIAVVSGCIFDSDNDKKNVKKGSVSGTVKMTITEEPLPNVKVFLVNRDAKYDTVSYTNNRTAFVDSTKSDSEGRYVFNGIAPGNYGVVPMSEDSTAPYKFTWAVSSDSCLFAMNGNTLSVNFIAEKSNLPAASDELIIEKIYVKNATQLSYKCLRRVWAVCIPMLEYVEAGTDQSDGAIYCSYKPGYTCLFYTLDNCIFFEVTFLDGTVRKFFTYHGLGAPVGTYKYTYDYNTDTLRAGTN